MSTFIQIPNRINQLTKKSKLEEIFTYAVIRSQIKDNSCKAIILQNQLAELMNVTDRCIRNYTDTLEKSGLIKYTTKKHGKGEYAHNVYQFDELTKEYFIMEPSLITEQSISPKLKGLLMLIKANCIKGTNYLHFNSQQHLSIILGIGKNTLPKHLRELESKGFIRYIGRTLHVPQEYFKLFLNDNIHNLLYKTIYDYCLMQDVVPPYKDIDTYDLGVLVTNFDTPNELLSILKKRCPKLPKNVSMTYFTETLTNKRAITRKTIKHE